MEQTIESLAKQLSSEGRSHFIEYAVHVFDGGNQPFLSYMEFQGSPEGDLAIAALIQQAMDAIKA
jgi:hypothetical protein